MKVAILILAVAIAGAFAQTTPQVGPPPFVCDSSNAFVCTFKKLGHQIKYHATKLGGQLKNVGSSVLSSLLNQGKSLLTNASQAVLGTVLQHLNDEGLVGKREELSFLGKVKQHIANGFELMKKYKEGIHAAFKKAVAKLTGIMTDNASLKKIEADTDKQIDDAVDGYNKSGNKGFFGMAKALAGKLREIFKAGLDKLKEKYSKKVETRAIFGFDSLKAAWEKAKQHLSGVAGTIADTFRPHIDTLKKGIAALGAKVKEHAGNLVNAAKDSFNTLKGKLSGHIDTLKGHAKKLGQHAVNAVTALKEAVASIAMQAVGNVKDTVGDIVKTGTDAAGVVGGHISDAAN